MIKNFILTTCILICFAYTVVLCSSCANIIPPTGGPRDSFPPNLINATPHDSTTHFATNRITLTFDEYVTVDNPSENLVVWPNPKTPPLVESKLRTVTIKLKDSLEANTTYTLNFGRSLKDVNEGNADSSFTYIFSTGKTLDRNKLRGKVFLAETGKIDTTLIAVLHKNLSDTAVQKDIPRYYSKIDRKGNFYFFNLPTDSFNLYVLPNDYSKKYDDSTKLFAFLNAPVYISDTNTKPVTLYAFREFKEEQVKTATPNTSKNTSKNARKRDTTLAVTTNLESGRQDFLTNLHLTFSDTLKTFDSAKFHLTDTNYKALPGVRLALDTVATKIFLNYKWTENTPYVLVIDEDAVADSADQKLAKSDTIKFSTLKESDYGSLRIRFQNLDTSKHPVLQVIKDDKVIDSSPMTGYEFYRKFYRPGDYELRLLYDTNKNGIWDTGSYLLKKQPEVARSVTTKEGGKITAKANQDKEYNITL